MIEKMFTLNIAVDANETFICSECKLIIQRTSYTSDDEHFEGKGNPFDYCPKCGRYIINTEGNINSDISDLIAMMKVVSD